MAGRSPTIYSIAKALGVHASTVSRALSRPEMVRPELVERVRAKATEVGYVSNPVARGLITGRTGMVGLLIPDIENPFFAPLVRAIQDAASGSGLRVLLVDSRRDPDAEAGLVAQVRVQVDGVICAAPRSVPSDLVDAAAGAPLVFINRTHPGTPSVTIDNGPALERACSRLVDQGHRRFAVLKGPSKSWAAKQRRKAVRRWADASGVDLVELGPIEALFEGGVAAAGTLAGTGATAVIAFDDVMACGVIAGLAAAGRRVPEDVSVVGCDDVLLARTMTPALTTISAPFADAGAAAMRLLQDAMAGRDDAGPVALPGVLVPRASTGPAPTTRDG